MTINSTNTEDWEPIQESIRAGEVDVLLVSPERLNNPGFRDEVLPRLAATCGLLGMLHYRAGDRGQAREWTLKARERCERMGDREGADIYAKNLSVIEAV